MYHASKGNKTLRKLALLMAFIMAFSIIGTVPIAMFGYEDTADTAYEAAYDEAYGEEAPEEAEAPEAPAEEVLYDTPENLAAFVSQSTVIFNLGAREVVVGHEGNPQAEAFFDADGRYTMVLEDNAFFPYEVQFQWNGETWVEWFYTPESTVVVGGYTFGVYSAATDGRMLTQIGLYIGDTFVVVYPQAKEFTNDPFAPFSLLPLTFMELDTINLREFNRAELANVRVQAIFRLGGRVESEPIAPDTDVVWAILNENRIATTAHTIITAADSVDLNNASGGFLELLVGSRYQLNNDTTRIRYIIEIEGAAIGLGTWLAVSFAQNGELVLPLSSPLNTPSNATSSTVTAEFHHGDLTAAQDIYLGLNWAGSFTDRDSAVGIFAGTFTSVQDARASNTEIINIWDQDLLQAGTGHPTTLEQLLDGIHFTIVSEDDDAIFFWNFTVQVNPTFREDRIRLDVVSYAGEPVDVRGIQLIAPSRNHSFAGSTARADRLLTIQMSLSQRGVPGFGYDDGVIQRAIVWEDFLDAEEILAQDPDDCVAAELFSPVGFSANFSGDGQKISILDVTGLVHHIMVVFTDEESFPRVQRIHDGNTETPVFTTPGAPTIGRPGDPNEEGNINIRIPANVRRAHYVRMSFTFRGTPNIYYGHQSGYIDKVVRGRFTNVDDIPTDPEVVNELFYPSSELGLRDVFIEGQDFTLVDIDGTTHPFTIKLGDVGEVRFGGVMGSNDSNGSPFIPDGSFLRFIYTLEPGLSADQQHYVRMEFWRGGGLDINTDLDNDGLKVVKGEMNRQQLEDLIVADPNNNIASQLFGDDGFGYNYSDEQIFTVFDGIATQSFAIRIQEGRTGVGFREVLDNGRPIGNSIVSSSPNFIRTLDIGENANQYLSVRMTFLQRGSDVAHSNFAVVRNHVDQARLEADVETGLCIASQLFGPNGLSDNFSDGREFTLFHPDEGIFHFTVTLQTRDNVIQLADAFHGERGHRIGRTASANEFPDDNAHVRVIRFDAADITHDHAVRLIFTHRGGPVDYNDFQVVLGEYTTAQQVRDIINADPARNISRGLFAPANYALADRFLTNFSTDQTFTILIEDEVIHFTVRFELETLTRTNPIMPPQVGTADTFFEMETAVEFEERGIGVYRLPFQHDTYYAMGFQTLFVLDPDPSLFDSLTPIFRLNTPGVNVYSQHGGNAGTRQVSEETVRTEFAHGQAVQYSAAAIDGNNLRNYWVTFVQLQQGRAELFVNGINGDGVEERNTRRVFFNQIMGHHHDIFIANIGDMDMTGLNVELIDAENVRLCDYWTVGGVGNDTLAAFTTTTRQDDFSELPNVAKIRLLPDGDTRGDINGILRITHDGHDGRSVSLDITITGEAGNPTMLTQSPINPPAVRFVPYAVQLAHDNMYAEWNQVTLWAMREDIDGNLEVIPTENNILGIPGRQGQPILPGVYLRPNGEIYGVPQEVSLDEFTFTVRMNHEVRSNVYARIPIGEERDRFIELFTFPESFYEFTLPVWENTNTNVWNESDVGYEVRVQGQDRGYIGTHLGGFDFVITGTTREIFLSHGQFGDFVRVWLNGEELDPDNYTAEDGSTRITLTAQTFDEAESGTNTIAMEFRTGGGDEDEGELRRTAQNFRVDPTSAPNDPGDTRPLPPGTEQPPAGSPLPPQTGGGSQLPVNPQPPRPVTPSQPATQPDPPPQQVIYEPTPPPMPPPLPPQDVVGRPAPVVVRVPVVGEEVDGVITIEPTLQQVLDALASASLRASLTPGAPIIIEFAPDSIHGGIHQVSLVLSQEMLELIAATPNAAISLYGSHLGVITVSEPQVITLVGQHGETIEISISRQNGTAVVSVTVDGVPFALSNIHVFLPNMGFGNVPELVTLTGLAQTIRKSVVENGNVHAILDAPGTVRLIQVSPSFTDVLAGDWFYNAVDFVASRELFVGVGNDMFAPRTTMTRGMMATLLFNLSNASAIGADAGFDDVAQGRWYSEAIAWAYQNNIVSGYGDGNFGPSDAITREQMVAILRNYTTHLGIQTPERGDLSTFPDSGLTSHWAVESMSWAVGAGLVEGNHDGLAPQDDATRAEVAQLFMRFVRLLVMER